MAKYKQEVKDAAVKAAKEGMHLKEIQRTIGPNPAAVKRYLAKEGINYAELLETLKKEGKGPKTVVQASKEKAAKKKAEAKAATTEVREA